MRQRNQTSEPRRVASGSPADGSATMRSAWPASFDPAPSSRVSRPTFDSQIDARVGMSVHVDLFRCGFAAIHPRLPEESPRLVTEMAF